MSIARARSAIAAQGFLRGRLEWRMLALLIVLIAGLSFVSPYFLTFSNISNVLDQSVVTGIVAIGQTFVILTAGIDLSVGSLVGFTGIVLGLSFARFGIPGAIVAALLADSHNDASGQLKNAQDAIARKVDGILISPTDSSTAPSVLTAAAQAKIPVVIADIGTSAGEYVSFIISDNESGAYDVGKKLVADLKAKNWAAGGRPGHDLAGAQ